MKDRQMYAVIGWDSAAAQAVKSLLALGMKVTVAAAAVPNELPDGVEAITGLPSDTGTLRSAGVEHADGILIALPASEAKLAITAARSLNPAIHVVASLQGDDPEIALWTAGAGEVRDAEMEAGKEMVRRMLDLESGSEEDDDKLYFSHMPIRANLLWAGLRLADLRGRISHVSVAAILPAGDSSRAVENDDARAADGDTLLVLGTKGQLKTAIRAATGRNP